MTQRVRWIVAGTLLVMAACRPGRMDHTANRGPVEPPGRGPGVVDRGGALYAAYCVGCHGAKGDERGPFAAMLGLQPANLRTPAVQRISDRELVARIMHGAPLKVAPGPSTRAEDLDVRAIAAYLPTLATHEPELLCVGRFVYEGACAACYGEDGQGLYSQDFLPPATVAPPLRGPYEAPQILHTLRREQRLMPHLRDVVGEAQVEAIVAYLRTLASQEHESRGHSSHR